MQSVVIDSKVVGHLVHDRDAYFANDIFPGFAGSKSRIFEDRNLVGKCACAPAQVPFGKGDALVLPQNFNVFWLAWPRGVFVFDKENDVIHHGESCLWNGVDRLLNQLFKLVITHL